MTDLCYNCGDCHLPQRCSHELRKCDICENLGHTYNFCPLSVRYKDPTYQFWALCHNCDKWHLPEACRYPLHQCKQCGNCAHLEHFCPVDPIVRNKGQTRAKRQRTDETDEGEKPGEIIYDRNVIHVHPELVRKIKLDAVNEAFHFLNVGYPQPQVLAHMGRPVSPPRPNGLVILPIKTNGNVKTECSANVKHEDQSLFVSSASKGNHSRQHSTAQQPTPGTPTPLGPATATGFVSQASTDGSVYAQMHERFDRGDLAHVLNSEQPHPQTTDAGYEHGNIPPGQFENGVAGQADSEAANQSASTLTDQEFFAKANDIRCDSAVQSNGNENFAAPAQGHPAISSTTANNADMNNEDSDNGLEILRRAMVQDTQQFPQSQQAQNNSMIYNSPYAMLATGQMPNPFHSDAFAQPQTQQFDHSVSGGMDEKQVFATNNGAVEEPKVEPTKKAQPKKRSGRPKKKT